MNRTSILSALTVVLGLGGCSSLDSNEIVPQAGEFSKVGNGKTDASAEAVFLQFEFDAHLMADFSWSAEQTIEDQLLYTIGHLNGDRSVGRLDKLELSNIVTQTVGGETEISYHASLLVAWGQKDSIPSTYTLQLPRRTSFAALEDFTNSYNQDCVDSGAHDVDSSSMWYYYRPNRFGCSIAAEDVVIAEATVSLSSINTTGMYPEYHKVWEDDVLKVVAIFGKYEDGVTSNSDAGITAYNRFARKVDDLLEYRDGYQTVPANLPSSPGGATPEVQFSAQLPDGRSIEVVALLVDNIRTAPLSFDARYEELSSTADLIVYNGHAGLGANIRAMAQKGEWVAGQYAIVFMNGCDTYAYVDSSLADAHAAVNDDDSIGSKYLDIITNALPSFFSSMPDASMALIVGLMQVDAPMTYESMFNNIDSAEVVLVSGEQDNVFVPGYNEGDDSDNEGEDDWAGLSESGSVIAGQEEHFATPTLAAGRYEFVMTGTFDADLYVRIGQAPTTGSYDCRPFLTGSSERCIVDLNSAAKIHLMVRGWSANSEFQLNSL